MKKGLLAMSSLVALCLSSCATGVHHDPSEYRLTLNFAGTGDFNILQLTDTHLGDKDDLDLQFKFLDLLISEAINEKHADMIVVTGDLFTFSSKTLASRYFSFLDSYNKPWTVTFGNHDEQCYYSVDWLTNKLNTSYKNCLFKDIQDDDVHGNSNFVIDVKKGGADFEQLVIMDSNRYDYSGFKGYDHFYQDQIDWYDSVVKPGVKSLMFYHIPLPEINDAWEHGEALPGVDKGEKREDTCPPKSDPGFFKVIKEKGSTNGMFFGHDHVNNFTVKYENVVFSYGIKSTDRVYFDEDMIGYQMISVHNDNSFGIERVYHTYKEVM